MKKLLLILLFAPFLMLGQNKNIPVFGSYEWISDKPIDIGEYSSNHPVKGFSLYNEYIKDQWNSEGVLFQRFAYMDNNGDWQESSNNEGARSRSSSFNYMIFDSLEDPYIIFKITFSPGFLREGNLYKIYYKIVGDKIELRYNNQKSIYYKNE